MSDQENQVLVLQAKLSEAKAALERATQVRESIRAYPFFARSLQQRRQAIMAEEEARQAVEDAEYTLNEAKANHL